VECAHKDVLRSIDALETEMLVNIWQLDWLRSSLPAILTVGVVGAALAYAFSAG
jgi:hypothetical protein